MIVEIFELREYMIAFVDGYFSHIGDIDIKEVFVFAEIPSLSAIPNG